MSKIRIVPYINKEIFRMGLEKTGKLMIDGVTHVCTMRSKSEGNSIRYINGLNPRSPEVMRLPKDQREAKQEQIKRDLIEFESRVGGAVISEDDPDWYSKITHLKPDNTEFWESADMRIELDNYPTTLDTSNVFDALKLIAIKEGGYPTIAISLEEVKTSNYPYKYYLDVEEETLTTKTEVSKLRNKAGAELQKLFEKNTNKLLYVTKLISPMSTSYKKSTTADVLYDVCDKFIEGVSIEKDKRKSAQMFLDTAALNLEDLKIRAMVKDAIQYKLISQKADGIYHIKSGTFMGKNIMGVEEFLKGPLNEDIYKEVLSAVEPYWNL